MLSSRLIITALKMDDKIAAKIPSMIIVLDLLLDMVNDSLVNDLWLVCTERRIIMKFSQMKKITNVWTLIYKEKDCEPLAYSYTSEKEATISKLMIEDSNGGEIINDNGEVDGCVELEWCYLINGKYIS